MVENIDESKFPNNLFIYNAWQVIGDILKRRFDNMWRNATPVDIDKLVDDDIAEKR